MTLEFRTFEAYEPRETALPEPFSANSLPYEAFLKFLLEQTGSNWSSYNGQYPLDAVWYYCMFGERAALTVGFDDMNSDGTPELFLNGDGSILSVYTVSGDSVYRLTEKAVDAGDNVLSYYSDLTIEKDRLDPEGSEAYLLYRLDPGATALTLVSRTDSVLSSHRFAAPDITLRTPASLPLRVYERNLPAD